MVENAHAVCRVEVAEKALSEATGIPILVLSSPFNEENV